MFREGSGALQRAIRIRHPEDALYWTARLRDEGASAEAIGRRLLQSAFRDNLNIPLMLEVDACVQKPDTGDLRDLAIRLALSHKMWSVREGRQLTELIYAVQADCSYRVYSDVELLHRAEAAFGEDERFGDFLRIVHEIWQRGTHFKKSPLPEFLIRLGKWARSTPVATLANLLMERAAKAATIVEETLLYLVVTWMVTGVWGQDGDPEPEGLRVGVAARMSGAERGAGEESIPGWAFAEDRRFESSWDGYANMCLMVERYGRLDPRDEGVIFLTKGGVWKPVIREENCLYLVQSQSNPKTSYEVNLAILSCTCRDFQKRQRPCKHIKAARQHAESKLPFVVV